MVAYATPDDVRLVVARDVLRTDFTAASLRDEQIQQRISNAQAQVDGRLAGRYTVPFDEGGVPVLVKQCTIDIAAYLCELVYNQDRESIDDSGPARLYMRAQALLKDIADGNIDLDADGVSTVSHGQVGAPINPPFVGLAQGIYRNRPSRW